MSRKNRVTGRARRQNSEGFTEQHQSQSIPLTQLHESARKSRRKARGAASIDQVIRTWRDQGLLEEAPTNNARLARSVGEEREALVMPLGQLLLLYAAMRTNDDRVEFVELSAKTLAQHECGARCMCGRVRRLASTLVDSLAVEAGVTPWLENPLYRVPGSAYSNSR